MHQASILFSAFVMLMGAAWVALYELSGGEASADIVADIVVERAASVVERAAAFD